MEKTARLGRRIVNSLGPIEQDLNELEQLASEWLRDRRSGVDVADLVVHPAYQRLIGKGERAVPFLLRQLEKKPDHWFWALHAITGANPVPPAAEGKLALMAEAWIAWGRSEGYIL